MCWSYFMVQSNTTELLRSERIECSKNTRIYMNEYQSIKEDRLKLLHGENKHHRTVKVRKSWTFKEYMDLHERIPELQGGYVEVLSWCKQTQRTNIKGKNWVLNNAKASRRICWSYFMVQTNNTELTTTARIECLEITWISMKEYQSVKEDMLKLLHGANKHHITGKVRKNWTFEEYMDLNENQGIKENMLKLLHGANKHTEPTSKARI